MFLPVTRGLLQVVGYDEMMEMLTDDAYAIDYTADEVTPGDMWGVEGGYGIISATQMLDWVKVNCAQACPGKFFERPCVLGRQCILHEKTSRVCFATQRPRIKTTSRYICFCGGVTHGQRPRI